MKRILFLIGLALALTLACRAVLPGAFTNKTVMSPSAASTTFVTGQTLGTDTTGNNGYELGMQINVQGASITVTQLGIWVISGSTGTHLVKIYSDPFGTPTSLGSVSINTTGLPVGFNYVTLGTPIVLSASTAYVVVGDYVVSTDHTYDSDTSITHTAVATVPNGVYRFGGTGTFGSGGSTDNCYVPVSFKYQ